MSKIKQSDLQTIREQFALLRTTEDLVVLLNCANDIIYPKINAKKRLTEKLLRYYAFHKENKYQTFTVLKKNGGLRTISAPDPYLKLLQKCLNMVLNIIFVPHKAVNGFVVNHDNKIRNIVTNAQLHTNKPYIYNIDLSDFFTSVAFRRIKTILQLAPFNLPDDIAFLVANLCSDNGVLPQGAPTSPTLTNAVCQRLDRKLAAFAKTHKIRYTRYADDITFSGYENIFNEEFYNQLKNIVEIEESFKINESKVRLQTRDDRQEVTGLTVNEKVNVEQRYIRSIRAMLHNWQNKGLEYATTKFRECYVKEKGAKRIIPPFESVLRGKLQFLQMVRGENDLVYSKYWKKFGELAMIPQITSDVNIDMDIKNKEQKQSIIEQLLPKSNPKHKGTGNENHTHNPQSLINFLQRFRTFNNTGLRDLVHAPINPNDFDLDKIVRKTAFDLNRLYKNGTIPPTLYARFHDDLFNIYKTEGKKIWNDDRKIPFLDPEFAEKIFAFKRTYKCGPEDGESTSLSKLIEDIIANCSYGRKTFLKDLLLRQHIAFLPSTEIFNAECTFLTDIVQLRLGLKKIFTNILQHSNINGNKVDKMLMVEKKIDVTSIRKRNHANQTITEVKIIDYDSICNKYAEDLLKSGDFNAIKNNLNSLCDWDIIATFPNDKFKINMLPPSLDPVPYTRSVDGFTHILTFYH